LFGKETTKERRKQMKKFLFELLTEGTDRIGRRGKTRRRRLALSSSSRER
jgi:hypothetical protein